VCVARALQEAAAALSAKRKEAELEASRKRQKLQDSRVKENKNYYKNFFFSLFVCSHPPTSLADRSPTMISPHKDRHKGKARIRHRCRSQPHKGPWSSTVGEVAPTRH